MHEEDDDAIKEDIYTVRFSDESDRAYVVEKVGNDFVLYGRPGAEFKISINVSDIDESLSKRIKDDLFLNVTLFLDDSKLCAAGKLMSLQEKNFKTEISYMPTKDGNFQVNAHL